MRYAPRMLPRILASALLLALGACRGTTDPDPLVGTYLATTLEMTSTPAGTVDLLAAGGTLGINVARLNVPNDYVTAGSLVLPPALNAGTPYTALLTGKATLTGSTVTFDLAADTFVRDLTYTLVENRLEARNQTVGSATYTLILTRQ
jgi:hypothetical protein